MFDSRRVLDFPTPHSLKDIPLAYNCITQKDIQPSQTCSEGYIFLLVYATVVFDTGPEGPELEG